MFSRRLFTGVLLALVSILWVAGCQSPEAAAQKLFADGKYQEVLSKYPESQIARRARAMIAEKLLEEGKYQEVLENYPDTRAAYLAHEEEARTLFNNKQYREVLEKFPTSALASDAERVLAEDLYNQGLLDSLVKTYPNSSKGKEVLEAQASNALEAAKKLKGEKRVEALQDVMRNYTNTAAYKEAATLMRDSRKK